MTMNGASLRMKVFSSSSATSTLCGWLKSAQGDVIRPHAPSPQAEPGKTVAETQPAAERVAADQPADEEKAEKPVDEEEEEETEEADKPAWVDAQLQMAVDRLGSELAQAK